MLELGAPNEALAHCLAKCPFDLVARRGTGGNVEKGPQRRRDRESGVVLQLGLAEAGAMKDALLRAGLPEPRRDRQMHLPGENVAEIVDSQGGLMGDDCLWPIVTTPAPKKPADEVVVLRRRQVGNSIEAAADSLEVTYLGVVVEMLLAVTGHGSLLGSEVAALERRASVEFPSSLGSAAVSHGHEATRSK